MKEMPCFAGSDAGKAAIACNTCFNCEQHTCQPLGTCMMRSLHTCWQTRQVMAKRSIYGKTAKLIRIAFRAMAAASFPERVHLFCNEGEELRVTMTEKQILFQTGGLVQTGQLQQSVVNLYSSRGPMVAQTSPNGIDFPDENLIKGHWKKTRLAARVCRCGCLRIAEAPGNP